jgi:hypothetical protein
LSLHLPPLVNMINHFSNNLTSPESIVMPS